MYILHGRNVLSLKGYGVLNKHHVTPASFYTLKFYAARAFASISQESLYGNKNSVLVVVEDLTNDFGTYSGPLSSFFNVGEGRLKELRVESLKTGKWNSMVFYETGKAAWKMVSSKTGKGKEFLQVSCHIDESKPRRKRGVPPLHTQDTDFAIDYIRVYFDGKKWIEKEKTSSGYWDGEYPFPEESLFP